MLPPTGQQILALIVVADDIRGSSKNVIKELHEIRIKKTIMLTGDNQATANAIGQQLNVVEVKLNYCIKINWITSSGFGKITVRLP